MAKKSKLIEYQRRPVAAGGHAVFIALSITLILEVVLASLAATRGLLVGIFLLIAASVAIFGAIIGWFCYKRLGAVVAGCVIIAVLPTVVILTAEGGVPRSLDAIEKVAFYWTFPFAGVFLLPALIGGLSAALMRTALAK